MHKTVSHILRGITVAGAASLLAGCFAPATTPQTDREAIRKEGRAMIEQIQKDRSLTAQQREAMIDRIRAEVESDTGEKLDAK